jgi:transposase
MKFKSSQTINQRIERITTNHLVVGIDIAKETHVAAAVNFRGIQQGRVVSFSNDRPGLEKLLCWVRDAQKVYGYTQVIFGVESTGHYFLNLAFGLRELGQTVVLVNPLTTKRNKENRDNRPSKNDTKDALTIADAVSRGYYSDWVVHEALYRKLRCSVNEREMLSTDLTAIGNQIQTVVDQAFPEFTSVFSDWKGVRAMATLKCFPLPSDIRQRTAEEIINVWREAGMKRAGGKSGLQLAVSLLLAARRSIGLTDTAPELGRQIARLFVRYEAIQLQLVVIDKEIEEQLLQMPENVCWPLQALGLSSTLTAFILANTGDLSRYDHGQQILALAGLSLAESMSGKRKGQIVLSKRGRRQLRKYLYLAMLTLVCNHPAFKRWHEHNVKVLRMKKQKSIFKLIGKLARIIVALAHSGEAFNESEHPITSIAV